MSRFTRSSREPEIARRLLGPFFIVAGTLHFTHTEMYERTMPSWVPLHRESVLVSGVAEIAGGLATFAPRLRMPVRWWLLTLLIAVFPANVHMALHPEETTGGRVPEWGLWLRLPVQGLLCVWVWRATRRPWR